MLSLEVAKRDEQTGSGDHQTQGESGFNVSGNRGTGLALLMILAFLIALGVVWQAWPASQKGAQSVVGYSFGQATLSETAWALDVIANFDALNTSLEQDFREHLETPLSRSYGPRTFCMVMGGMASGKSTLVRNLFAGSFENISIGRRIDYVVYDSDNVIYESPAYQELLRVARKEQKQLPSGAWTDPHVRFQHAGERLDLDYFCTGTARPCRGEGGGCGKYCNDADRINCSTCYNVPRKLEADQGMNWLRLRRLYQFGKDWATQPPVFPAGDPYLLPTSMQGVLYKQVFNPKGRYSVTFETLCGEIAHCKVLLQWAKKAGYEKLVLIDLQVPVECLLYRGRLREEVTGRQSAPGHVRSSSEGQRKAAPAIKDIAKQIFQENVKIITSRAMNSSFDSHGCPREFEMLIEEGLAQPVSTIAEAS